MSPEPVDSTGGQPHRIRPGSMRVMLSIQSLVVAAAEAELTDAAAVAHITEPI